MIPIQENLLVSQETLSSTIISEEAVSSTIISQGAASSALIPPYMPGFPVIGPYAYTNGIQSHPLPELMASTSALVSSSTGVPDEIVVPSALVSSPSLVTTQELPKDEQPLLQVSLSGEKGLFRGGSQPAPPKKERLGSFFPFFLFRFFSIFGFMTIVSLAVRGAFNDRKAS